MEDNEFEEVTIISHTDHGTSVLPQSTAERLMKEIKLEVLQVKCIHPDFETSQSTLPSKSHPLFEKVWELTQQAMSKLNPVENFKLMGFTGNLQEFQMMFVVERHFGVLGTSKSFMKESPCPGNNYLFSWGNE